MLNIFCGALCFPLSGPDSCCVSCCRRFKIVKFKRLLFFKKAIFSQTLKFKWLIRETCDTGLLCLFLMRKSHQGQVFFLKKSKQLSHCWTHALINKVPGSLMTEILFAINKSTIYFIIRDWVQKFSGNTIFTLLLKPDSSAVLHSLTASRHVWSNRCVSNTFTQQHMCSPSKSLWIAQHWY